MSEREARFMGFIGWALLLVVFVIGCTTQQVQPDSFCSWAQPIIISQSQDKLSAQTAREILSYNEKAAKLCGWR